MAIESGYSKNGIPYVKFGRGSRLLFFLQGLFFENKPPSGIELASIKNAVKPLLDDYTVYAVTRRPGLSKDASMTSMAADYAQMITDVTKEPVDVIGTSTGGSIAQHLAADYPHLVSKLVLHSSAYALNEDARKLQLKIGELAEKGKWRAAYWAILSFMLPKHPVRMTMTAPLMAFGALLAGSIGTPEDPSDLIITIEAEDKHDFSERLHDIIAPTLVLAGTEDPFYSRKLFEQTAAGIPQARLILYEGKGHGVSGRRCRKDLAGFLIE